MSLRTAATQRLDWKMRIENDRGGVGDGVEEILLTELGEHSRLLCDRNLPGLTSP